MDIDPPVRIRADRSSLQFPQSEKQNFSFSIPLNRNSSTLQTRSRIAALLTHAREWTREPTPSVSIVRVRPFQTRNPWLGFRIRHRANRQQEEKGHRSGSSIVRSAVVAHVVQFQSVKGRRLASSSKANQISFSIQNRYRNSEKDGAQYAKSNPLRSTRSD